MHIDRGEPLGSRPASREGARQGSRPGSSNHKSRHGSPAQPGHPADGIVRVARETRGRKGKGVTLVTGLRLPPDALEALCKELKQRCGAGGAVKDGVIEIQGDHRDALVTELEKRGHAVKRAGG